MSLPTKWAVRRSPDNAKFVNDWFNKGCKTLAYVSSDCFVHFPNFQTSDGFLRGQHSSTDLRIGYEEITFKQFKEFVLKHELGFDPMDWNIELTDIAQCDEVMKYFSNYHTVQHYHYGNLYQFLSLNRDRWGGNGSRLEPIQKAISWEQFQNLKKLTMPDIIGYKVPCDMSAWGVRKGDLFKISSSTLYQGTTGQKPSIAKEIVETWEPVHVEESKELTLGNPARKFIVKREIVILVDDGGTERNFNKVQLQDARELFDEKSFHGYGSRVESVHFGCSDGTTLTVSDITQLQKTQNSLT